jgi:hypothetical protein
MSDPAALEHNVASTPAVYFLLARPVDEVMFQSVIQILEEASGTRVSQASVRQHWDALTQRIAGSSRWDSIMPLPVVSVDDPDRIDKLTAAAQTFDNILKMRGYVPFVINGLRFTIDVFNPQNELELPGWSDEWSVLALMFAPTRPGGRSTLRDLASSEPFYDLLLRMDNVVHPLSICGTFSLASMVHALHDRRMHSAQTLWEVLYPLTVVPQTSNTPSHALLSSHCAVVRSWPRNRILLQVNPGFHRTMDEAYARVAEMVGLGPWTRYVEGRDPDEGTKAGGRVKSPSQWPTPVRDDGKSPTSIELVGSGNPALVRQALYQMQAAAALKDRGDEIFGFQVPFIGQRVRLTVPVVLTRRPGPDAGVYTECESWTPERIAALQNWIRELRQESDSPVIVVARERSAAVAALPDVSEFIHLPYDQLPEGSEPAS